jgi:hypothetical protein
VSGPLRRQRLRALRRRRLEPAQDRERAIPSRLTVPALRYHYCRQETGVRGKEPLRTLATYRQSDGEVIFGRNLIQDALGTVHLGDPVEITPR